MKLFPASILFLATFFFFVKAQEKVIIDHAQNIENQIKTTTIDAMTTPSPVIVDRETITAPIIADSNTTITTTNANYKEHGYFTYLRELVTKAQHELRANRNRRPSTSYSIHDIAFTIAQYLPTWFYPPTLWKEDPQTRRRHIAKVLRTTPLTARPHVLAIRDQVTRWAHNAGQAFQDDYLSTTIDDITSLLQTAEDFVTTATDVEMMDSLFLSSGYLALDEAVNHVIQKNHANFESKLNTINHDFDRIIALSGGLRRSLESVRWDAVEQTKMVQRELFQGRIEQPLHHLSWHIRNELQHVYQELRKISAEEDRETSRALRKLTADSLRAEVRALSDVKLTLQRSKSLFHRVWEQAAGELYQSPASLTYWVDVVAEIKEAAIQLGQSLAERHRRNQYKKCKCGY
ncbi:MAG: hypothetical protein EXX96DRAFT_654130 [Benjaminiella poitrasii]|nr:MAG: hypothetical protein EXX96DRAFT_654130 [Benjaminiella poitrasii]